MPQSYRSKEIVGPMSLKGDLLNGEMFEGQV